MKSIEGCISFLSATERLDSESIIEIYVESVVIIEQIPAALQNSRKALNGPFFTIASGNLDYSSWSQ